MSTVISRCGVSPGVPRSAGSFEGNVLVATAAVVFSLWASGAAAQTTQAAQAQSSTGGVATGGGVVHLTSTGLGMGVGRSANAAGTVVSYEGFLARYVAARDTVPPVFDPPLQDLIVPVPANAPACAAAVNLPAVRVVDNRDPNPTVRVTVSTVPPTVYNDGLAHVLNLPLGSYDVVAVATDRRGNSAQATYRVDVVDTTAPTLVSMPNPTPAGQEAEATSPAGTPVALAAAVCRDTCDAAPTVSNNAPARFPIGDTAVQYTCRDRANNQQQGSITVRVRDRTAPAVSGGAPPNFVADCNDPVGSIVRVPAVAWADNGYSANRLRTFLIVDPDSANLTVDPFPEQVTLTGGRHVLRYVAIDPPGNRGQFDLQVTVTDNSAPRIEVVNAPALGWYNQDANVNLRVTDNCSAIGNNLQIVVQPPPTAQAINGGVVTLQYQADGVYNLNISVTDGAGNTVVDNSIGFGIDRTLPNASVVVPSQLGVVQGQPHTYPLYALAETMPLNVGADDPGDGQVSGVRRVQVLLDPDAQGNPARTLADQTFNGNGNPPRGARLQGNVRCTDNVAGDAHATCNAAREVLMRKVPAGPHVLRIIVTDFAGNSSTLDARVVNANLRDGLDIVQTRIQARLQPGQPALTAQATQELNRALPKLARGRLVAATPLVESGDYRLPLFTGSALKAVQDATINMTEAVVQAAAGDRPTLNGFLSVLHRVARSDIVLFREVIEDADIVGAILDDPDLANWLLPEYALDMDNAEGWIAAMEASMAGERWTNAAAGALEAFFSLKSAWAGWMMDYNFRPGQQFPAAQFERAASILGEIQAELSVYLQLGVNAPAEHNMRDMRDRIDFVAEELTRLAQFGFDNANGLSDEEYLNDMLELQNIANSSMMANQQGAWVRNYQWSMMQVVRLMGQSSTSLARLLEGAVANQWPLFITAKAAIDDGQDMLAHRHVQEVIELYGRQTSTCSIIAVYHCHFLEDEGLDDVDLPYTAQLADTCWEDALALHPDDWDGAPAGPIPAECRWGPDLQ